MPAFQSYMRSMVGSTQDKVWQTAGSPYAEQSPCLHQPWLLLGHVAAMFTLTRPCPLSVSAHALHCSRPWGHKQKG